MNIFLDKSLPKRTQILLQILRVVLLVILFGGIYLASINPEVSNILLYSSVGFAILFMIIKLEIGTCASPTQSPCCKTRFYINCKVLYPAAVTRPKHF